MSCAGVLACTADELTLLAPVSALPSGTRKAVSTWLHQHGIDPTAIAVGRPITRDEHRAMLVWREQAPDGVLVRTRLPGRTTDHAAAPWPAPFPVELLRST